MKRFVKDPDPMIVRSGAEQPMEPLTASLSLTCFSGSSLFLAGSARKRELSVAVQHVTRLLSLLWHLCLQDRKWRRSSSCNFRLLLTDTLMDDWDVKSSCRDVELLTSLKIMEDQVFDSRAQPEREGAVRQGVPVGLKLDTVVVWEASEPESTTMSAACPWFLKRCNYRLVCPVGVTTLSV